MINLNNSLLCELIIICQNMNDNIDLTFAPTSPSQRQEELLRFPKIQRIPSRGVQKQVKSSTRLPSIKIQPIEVKREEQTERILATSEEDFVGQVERKIRMVLQEQQIEQLQESQQSDEDNFQKKIIENKEIIKKVKRKNEKLKKQNAQANNAKMHLNLVRKISHPNKNEIHEKRIRQYKQGAVENIYLQKKKELLASLSKQKESNELKEVRNFNGALKQFVSNKQISLRQAKSKEQLTPLNKILNNNRNPLNSAAQPRKLNKQLSHKILSPLQKNQQLFDAIHNYLQNPKRHDIEAIEPFKMGKEKQQLQKKLRWYEQKINASACEEKQIKNKMSVGDVEINKSDIKMMSNSQWSKIGVNNRGLFAQQNSSFDKQIDRINRYLQRNEQSLQKYVQNQKMLVDVSLIPRKPSDNK